MLWRTPSSPWLLLGGFFHPPRILILENHIEYFLPNVCAKSLYELDNNDFRFSMECVRPTRCTPWTTLGKHSSLRSFEFCFIELFRKVPKQLAGHLFYVKRGSDVFLSTLTCSKLLVNSRLPGGVNRVQSKAIIPVSSHFFQSHEEGSA